MRADWQNRLPTITTNRTSSESLALFSVYSILPVQNAICAQLPQKREEWERKIPQGRDYATPDGFL